MTPLKFVFRTVKILQNCRHKTKIVHFEIDSWTERNFTNPQKITSKPLGSVKYIKSVAKLSTESYFEDDTDAWS